jgi:hypothetical protein
MDAEDRICELLCEDILHFDKLEDNGIFEHIDAFVSLSRENEIVEEVTLCLSPDPDAHRYGIWDKIAEGIGNLQGLIMIIIVDLHDNDIENRLAPDWNIILACILRRLRGGIQLCMRDDAYNLWDAESLQAFAGAIDGHAMITGFHTGNAFPFHCLDFLCSGLLTLPALENIYFDHLAREGPEEGQSLESMVKLLQSPTLRHISFENVVFTNNLSQAVAKALRERSEITELNFPNCFFPEGGSAVIASALKTNTTLKCLEFYGGTDEVFYDVLAAALLSNSTLENLQCSAPDSSGSCSWLSPLFLALQVNSGLRELCIDGIVLIDKKLSTAMRLGLGNSSTLETFKLTDIRSGDNDACLWREALSFLRTNSHLKTLHMHFEENERDSGAAAIRMEVLAALRENESLETLEMISENAGLKDFLECVDAIQPNTTLKRLGLHIRPCDVEDDDMKVLTPVLTKNYGLEELLQFRIGEGDTRSIFDLNRAGRRYLVQDGSSISKGVDMLSRVSGNINCVFLHLLENPRLCDRSAVENAKLMSPGNRTGQKREQQSLSHAGKEPRRRLE